MKEQVEDLEFNKVIHVEVRRPDGSLRVAQDFSNCVSMTDQSRAHETDINYLMKRHQPDELAAYISARNINRKEILNHDFSQETDMAQSLTLVGKAKKVFEELPIELRSKFKNVVQFFQYLDNPGNEDKLIQFGLATKEQIAKLRAQEPTTRKPETPTTTQEEEKVAVKT